MIVKLTTGALAFAVGFATSYAVLGPRLAVAVGTSSIPMAPVTPARSADLGVAGGDASDGDGATKPAAEVVGRVLTGFIDRTGRWAIAPQFVQVRPFKEGMAAVVVDDRWGFVDKEGKIVILPTFFETSDFSEGLALVRNEERKVGFVDRSGKMAIDYQFDAAWPFRSGVAIVGAGAPGERKYRLIRKNGDMAAGLGWEPIGNFAEGIAPVRISESQIGFFDKTGRVIVRVRLDAVRDFSDGMAIGMLHGKMGAMNREWRVVITPAFADMTDFAEGLAGAILDSKFGFMDKKGRWVVEPTYENGAKFSEGLAAVSRDGRYGYIDRTGHEVIDFKFEEVGPFSHGLAAVRSNGKVGFIDPKGNWVIEPQFTRAGDFGDDDLVAATIITAQAR